MVLQSVPHPQLAILVSSFMPISPFPIRFLHLLARTSTTSGISDAYALSLTSVQPTSLAYHDITRTFKARLLQLTVLWSSKNPVNSSPAYPTFSCSCRCCSSCRSSDPDQSLKSLHWLKVQERIEYKIISTTFKVLQSSSPHYLRNIITIQPSRSTRSSSLVTLLHPQAQSSLN